MTDFFPNNPWTIESKVGPSSKSGLLTIYCTAVGSETIKRFFYENDGYRTLCNSRRGDGLTPKHPLNLYTGPYSFSHANSWSPICGGSTNCNIFPCGAIISLLPLQ